MSKICVIGSINMDYVSVSNKRPAPGETIVGTDFYQSFGGKGANQAIAISKLGGSVSFIGACGNDSINNQQIENFIKHNVDISGIETVEGSSGVAQINITNGENSIIIVAGANGKVDTALVDRHINLIEDADIIVIQFEIPLVTVEHTINLAHSLGKKIILNPAPMVEFDLKLLDKCTYVTPNEIEIEQMFGDDFRKVLKKYSNKMIMTKGKEGVYYHNGDQLINVKAHPVESIDSTGAGDTFNGAFAKALACNIPLQEAVEFANLAASKSVKQFGAQTAMPSMEEME